MKNIAIIIPSYNNCQWYQRNLSSVIAQDYQNFRVIYIDDCSSDGTGELVEQFIAEHNSGNLTHLIRNPSENPWRYRTARTEGRAFTLSR